MTSTAKVAFDMTFPNRNRGGSGVYAHSLLRELEKSDDVAMRTLDAKASSTSGTLRWLANGVWKSVKNSNAHLLHCPAFVAPGTGPLPLVITMHDAAALRFPNDSPLEWRIYNRFFLTKISRRANAVITGTEASRSDLARYYGINPRRIHVTRYGIDPIFSQTPFPDQERSYLKSQTTSPVILFSGAPIARKNLPTLLEAMATAPSDSALASALLWISGASAEKHAAAVEAIRAKGLEHRVRWLGFVPKSSLPDIYSAADVLAYPSYYEGFGLPPLEAMSAGTPVVSSNASCLPETLGDGALYFDPHSANELKEALEAVLTKNELRADLIRRGRSQAANYSWEACAAATVQVYKKVLSNSPLNIQRPTYSQPDNQSAGTNRTGQSLE